MQNFSKKLLHYSGTAVNGWYWFNDQYSINQWKIEQFVNKAISLSDLDCRGEKMENGGTKIRVMDDFTKCDMLVEEVQDINENGEFYVTDYKFTNHLVHDASHGSVSIIRN